MFSSSIEYSHQVIGSIELPLQPLDNIDNLSNQKLLASTSWSCGTACCTQDMSCTTAGIGLGACTF